MNLLYNLQNKAQGRCNNKSKLSVPIPSRFDIYRDQHIQSRNIPQFLSQKSFGWEWFAKESENRQSTECRSSGCRSSRMPMCQDLSRCIKQVWTGSLLFWGESMNYFPTVFRFPFGNWRTECYFCTPFCCFPMKPVLPDQFYSPHLTCCGAIDILVWNYSKSK